MFKKIFKTIIGILLIPIVIGTGKAFCTYVADIGIDNDVLLILERGIFTYLLFHVFIIKPVYLYVLAHECVHVLATWISGGKVESFDVTPTGGNVITSKTNIFIELSPYFVPLYTILLCPIFLILRATSGGDPFIYTLFIFLVGFTLAFHFVMTSDAMRIQQSDIMKSGLIFSLVLIFTANLILAIALFSPFFEQLSFMNFIKESVTKSQEIYMFVYERGVEWVDMVRA